MGTEIWMLVATAACAVVPWAFSIHAKVAVIAASVEGLPKVVEEIREALQEHEDRLNEHAGSIKALQEKTGMGG